MNRNENPRLLLLVAHPDDAEYCAGGLCSIYRRLGRQVKMISVTDGRAGHHEMKTDELVLRRRVEAKASADSIGAKCEVWHFPDGRLTPSIEVREQIIREVREFQPDLVLTHRTCDYHPDHRAVATAVQDASYLFTVPLVCPNSPALQHDPVVAYMVDEFTRPNILRADVVIDIADRLDSIVDMLAHHESQFFEWLPYNHHVSEPVPADIDARKSWLRNWYQQIIGPRIEHFRDQLIENFGEGKTGLLDWIEVFEISEYAGKADNDSIEHLFPGRVT